MNNIIGFYKELDADEKIVKESPHLVEIYEKRGCQNKAGCTKRRYY